MYSFLDLQTFEKYVIERNAKEEKIYILSKYFPKISNGGTFLSRISIFDMDRGTVKQDKNKVQKILQILMSSLPSNIKKIKLDNELKVTENEKRAIGCMLGMAIGDAMGARYEFLPVRYNKIDLTNMGKGPGGKFSLFPGQWTDDTSMGLCLADSLLMKNGVFNPKDLMHRFIAWFQGGYNNAFRFNLENGLKPRHSVGLGGNISLSFSDYIYFYNNNLELPNETQAGDENTSGNGSIMRNAAIPICFHNNITLALENAKKQSLVTHKGTEARDCCSLLTYIIVKIFEGRKLKEEILENLDKFEAKDKRVEYLAKHLKEGNNDDRNWNWKIKDQYKYSPFREKKSKGYIGSYAMDAMAMSLNIIYNTDNFKDAIIKTVNLRGDSDTVASVVGQIAGAYYPLEDIPNDWIKEIYRWDQGEIALRGYMLSRLLKRDSYII